MGNIAGKERNHRHGLTLIEELMRVDRIRNAGFRGRLKAERFDMVKTLQQSWKKRLLEEKGSS